MDPRGIPENEIQSVLEYDSNSPKLEQTVNLYTLKWDVSNAKNNQLGATK